MCLIHTGEEVSREKIKLSQNVTPCSLEAINAKSDCTHNNLKHNFIIHAKFQDEACKHGSLLRLDHSRVSTTRRVAN